MVPGVGGPPAGGFGPRAYRWAPLPPPWGTTTPEVPPYAWDVADVEQRMSDLGAFIAEQRKAAKLSLRKLGERAGISNPYLSQVERGLRRPSADILQRIAKALEISAETLYVQAGILEEPAEDDLVVHIRRDPHLTEQQKRTLVHIYESFRTGEDQPT